MGVLKFLTQGLGYREQCHGEDFAIVLGALNFWGRYQCNGGVIGVIGDLSCRWSFTLTMQRIIKTNLTGSWYDERVIGVMGALLV